MPGQMRADWVAGWRGIRTLRNLSKKWTMPIRDWKAALTRFTISYEDRLPQQ